MKEIDFSLNLNFLGAPEGTEDVARDAAILITRYPDHSSKELKELAENKFGVDKNAVTFGAGTTEIIYNLPHVLRRGRVLIPRPSFWQFKAASRRDGRQIVRMDTTEEEDFRLEYEELRSHIEESSVVFLCNPNNPTSRLFKTKEIKDLVDQFPDVDFVVDETYLLFMDDFDIRSLMQFAPSRKNLYVITSLSKFFVIPGLRLGMMVSSTQNIRRYEEGVAPYTVSPMAGKVLGHVLNDEAFIDTTRATYKEKIPEAYALGTKMLPHDQCTLIKPEGPFMLIKLTQGTTSGMVRDALANLGIMVRDCEEIEGLGNQWIRASCRSTEEMTLLFSNLADILRRHGNT